jgi:hypothetical protein
VITMAWRKKKRGSSRKAKAIPVAVALPLAVAAVDTFKYAQGGNWSSAAYVWTGVNKNGGFDSSRVMQTYVPIAAGVVVHKVANRVGVNNFVRRVSMGYLSI